MNAHVAKPMIEFDLGIEDLKAIVDSVELEQLLVDVKSPGHPERTGSYQYTHRGALFFPCDPHEDEVFIEDIAHGVASMHRFNGQTTKRMTVAEHLYLCSFVGAPETALERLMHDASEAYIGDVIRPLKIIPLFGALYLKIERAIEYAIARRYQLAYPHPPCVKYADELIAHVEVAQNIGSKAINHLVDPAFAAQAGTSKINLYYWAPDLAEKMFLYRFHELAEERGIEPF